MNEHVRSFLRSMLPASLRARHMRRYLPRPAPLLDFVPAPAGARRRALLSFKASSFLLRPDDPQRTNFSHEGLGPAMASALHDLGYGVDVFDYRHPAPVVERSYDLFVGHMNINFTRIARQLPLHVPRLYFATTLPSPINNRNERRRLADLCRRRGVRLGDERRLFFDEVPAYRAADAILCLGNEACRAAYLPYAPVYSLRNAARDEPRDIPASKNFASARRHFLFYAGPGNVHKGLDLLLEVFPALAADGLHLHVCQHLDSRFSQVYARELTRTPNIHVHGNVAPRQSQFYAIADQCAFLLSPSCAEGSQGAVIEGLHQGLVSILSRESTVDPGPGGILLPDCAPASIEKAVREAAVIHPEELLLLARQTQEMARRDYTEQAFVAGFRDAVTDSIRIGGRRGPLTTGII